MEYVYAAMLLHKAGKEISEKNLTQVLTAAGIKADSVKVKALKASLVDVDIEEAIKTASTSIISTPAASVAAPTEEEKPKEEEKKEDEKQKEEEALEGLGALFG